MPEKVSILLDGAFAKIKLEDRLGRFPTDQDVVDFCAQLMAKPRLQGKELFRTFFYDAPPFEEQISHPMGGIIKMAGTPQAARNRKLLDAIELQPDFVVRRGTCIHVG